MAASVKRASRLRNARERRPSRVPAGPDMLSSMPRPLASVLLALVCGVAAGCESSVRYDLRFVDETTGQPIEGAKFEAMLWGHHFNNRLFPAEGRENAPPSGADGRTTLRLKRGEGLSHYLAVTRPGYHALTGQIVGGGTWSVVANASDLLPSQPVGRYYTIAASPGAPVQIKMRPLRVEDKPSDVAAPPPDLSDVLRAGQTVDEARAALGVPPDEPQVYVGGLGSGTIPLSSPKYPAVFINLHVEPTGGGGVVVRNWTVGRRD